jgi:hypothetical protein
MSKRSSLSALVAASVLILPGFAAAADCPLSNAVYSDRDGTYQLKFSPLNSDAAAASNQFKMTVKDSKAVLDGYVMPSEDPARTIGMVMFNCPEGDATGADLDACTIWQGPVYGVDDNGAIDNLPGEKSNAVASIVLPAIGPALRDSSILGEGKQAVAPWDVFSFKECVK